jgi:hypothetical protein
MRKLALGLLLLTIIASVGVYFYMYQEHRDIANEDSTYSTTVSELVQQYTSDVAASDKKYLDQTIEVSGIITSIDAINHSIVLDEKLSAVFNDSILPKFSMQSTIKIKGRFIGFDDLLEELKMDQVSLSE